MSNLGGSRETKGFLVDPAHSLAIPTRKKAGAAFAADRQVSDLLQAVGGQGGVFGERALNELQSLAREKNPNVFFHGLRIFGLRLEDEGKTSSALQVYQFVAQRSPVPEIAKAAQDRLSAFQGQGPRGIRTELMIDRLMGTGPFATVAGFGIASVLARVTRVGVAAQLFSSPASIFTRGLGAELLAGGIALGVEGPAFVAGTKGAEQLLGLNPQWSFEAFKSEVPHAYLTILPLKVAGAAAQKFTAKNLTQADFVSHLSRLALPQAAMLVGITGGLGLQNAAGMKSFTSFGDLLWDGAAMFVEFQIAGSLAKRALGPEFHRMELTLDAHAESMTAPKIFSSAPLFNFAENYQLAPAGFGGGFRFSPPQVLMSSMGGDGSGGGSRGPKESQSGTRFFSHSPKGTSPDGIHTVKPESEPPGPHEIVLVRPQPKEIQPPTILQVPAVPAPIDPQAQQHLGRVLGGQYRLDQFLGSGAIGMVFLATDLRIGRRVAVKMLNDEYAGKEEATKRFIAEAHAASRIQSENIISIFNFGNTPEATYMVMEALKGKDLDTLLAERPMIPVNEIVPIAHQIAKGLQAAHEAHLVHRDLKPGNVFLVDRNGHGPLVKILDFGIVKFTDADSQQFRLTKTSLSVGTPQYMSPEQIQGDNVGPSADIYSLGVMLYEMASGQPPFTANNLNQLMIKHIKDTPVPLNQLKPPPPNIPEGFDALVQRCLQKDPKDRPASMGEIMVELEWIQQGLTPPSVAKIKEINDGIASVPPKSQLPLGLKFAVGGGVALIGGLVALLFSGKKEGQSLADAGSAPSVNTTPTPAPQATSVALAVEPIKAKVYRVEDGSYLGENPVIIPIEKGSKVEVDVKLDGYITQRIILDGSKEREAIRLEPVPVPSSSSAKIKNPKIPPSSTKVIPVKPKPSSSSDNMVDPWK